MSDTKSDWFLKLNPRGQIPTLEDGDYGLGESVAIQSYILSKKKHDSDYYPLDIKKKNKVFAKISYELTSFRAPCLKLYYTEILNPWFFKKPTATKDELKVAKENFDKEISNLATYLKDSEGPYLTGEHFTVADSNIFLFTALVVHNGIHNLDKEPIVKEWYENCAA